MQASRIVIVLEIISSANLQDSKTLVDSDFSIPVGKPSFSRPMIRCTRVRSGLKPISDNITVRQYTYFDARPACVRIRFIDRTEHRFV